MNARFVLPLSLILVVPVAVPAQVAPARPVAEPAGPVPVAPARPVEEPAAPPAPAGEFLRPDPANDLLAFADLLASRGDFASALARYEEFLRANPNHPAMRRALYQTAECLRKLDRADDAENTYALIVDKYQRGEMVDAAAYRAAALAYNRRDFRAALPYFNVARTQTADPKLKADATFRAARCLEAAGRKADAAPLFQELVSSPDANPFQEPARLSLARIAFDLGRREEALPFFEHLAASAGDPVVRGEALVRAGRIHSDLGHKDQADALFDKVFALAGADAWKPVAQMALVEARYKAKDYQGVVDAYNKGVFQLPDEMRAQMFLMTGNSFLRLGRFPDAIKTYGILENFFQGTPEGQEAGYRRLQCLYQNKDPNLVGFIDHYVKREKDAGRPSHRFIDRALLLKAETLFAVPNAVAAAEAYSAIKVENLPENLRAGVLYKMSWAQAEAGQRPQAIDSLNRFIQRYPQDPQMPVAYVRRAELLERNGDEMRALQDYQTVIEKYGDSPGAEYAYQQAARIHGNKNDNPGMVKLYQALLEKFPKTKAAPEAYYALGRGYYRMKDYLKAVENLRRAREADPKLYGRPAGSRIALSCYALKDAVTLRKELDLFLKDGSAGELPPQVLAWLGVKLYEEGDATGAATYLGLASNENEPKATEPVIWKYLGKARLDAGQYREAVTALDHYLAGVDQPAARASALLDKARAQFGLRAFDQADLTASEGQQAVRQGKTNAWLSLLRGDIAMAQNKFDDAIGHYSVPSQTMVDPEITPNALWRLVQALQKVDRRDEAKKFKLELTQKYPSFEPPAGGPIRAVPEEHVKPADLPPPELPPEGAPAGPAPPTPPASPPPAPAADEAADPPGDVLPPGVPTPAENPVEP